MIKRVEIKKGKLMVRKHLPIFIFLLTFFSPVQAKVIEGIAAVVDGEVITLSELEEFLGPERARQEGVNIDIGREEARRRALERLIERKVLLQEAKDKGIEVREERIDRRLGELRERFASEEEFRQALREENLTEAKLRRRIEKDLMVSLLIDKEVRARIRVGGEEIRLFFEENRERFKEPEEVELSHILIKAKEGEVWKEKKGEELLRRLREGADFSLLAREYSQGPTAKRGGRLGFLRRGELSPEFAEAVSGLEVGEVSDLIKMEDGFHIIKLKGRKAARQMELSEVKDIIEALIFAEKAEKRYQEWVKELKKEAHIEIR